ncbi:M15 family metallopeptidase [Pseudidiomarina aestuarii]|uniref:M15 family metallopeptidase n=1 Tax=Pseudidiomarina aestuarii TaxID=624146 RepID=UPI003A97B45D
MLSTRQLTGLEDTHVVTVTENEPNPRLQPAVVTAWQAMQQAAANSGVSLAIASGFRDYARQLAIWNRKYRGEAPLYNDRGDRLDSSQMNCGEKLEAILTWSALPGASRHHWGTDFDVYDPRPFAQPDHPPLELTVKEYSEGGPCFSAYQWLIHHARDFGFFFPYARYLGGVASEPWHLSYAPLALDYLPQLTTETLKEAMTSAQLLGLEMEGYDYVLERLDDIKERYIDAICQPDGTGADVWFG